jgi:formate dehydrogenase subunit gamma
MITSSQNTQSRIRQICDVYDNQPATLIEILHDVQDENGFLAKDALIEIANALNISRADIYGVVTFYHDFRQEPLNGPDIRICRAEACQAVGAGALATHAAKTCDTRITDAYCLGNCALGPAVMVDGSLYGRVDTERLTQILKQRGEQ